ncbi:nitrile hydratase subunit beta [Tardiphaga sp.]|uniref:nitrile hydratase subunit beta n=1 Tax=Tardiphaga sp. TaxID=1926292 RepID=UPI0026066571|nr:nitrile hydratase subunit beta [Tardiphaga sp.]MDB5617751.1 Nitrile hydratase subunit beta [Tardiphaga sp.]
MDGAHDMGGAFGFGAVQPEPNEPVFHAEWERRTFAMTLAMARPGQWNIDASRFARENRPAVEYLGKSYFQIWLVGIERLMAERGLVSPEEIETSQVLLPRKDVPVLKAGHVAAMLRKGGPTLRSTDLPARFAIGDRVRARVMHPPTHTRLPQYVRGHVGVIERLHGAHVFPDSHAMGQGEQPQWLYTVAFDGRELWGDDGDASATVSVDAWDSYLEPA